MTTVVPIYAQHKLGALLRAPRRTVEYACGALSRALLAKRRIHARLRRLATKPCEKCGLALHGFIKALLDCGRVDITQPHEHFAGRALGLSDAPARLPDLRAAAFQAQTS